MTYTFRMCLESLAEQSRDCSDEGRSARNCQTARACFSRSTTVTVHARFDYGCIIYYKSNPYTASGGIYIAKYT